MTELSAEQVERLAAAWVRELDFDGMLDTVAAMLTEARAEGRREALAAYVGGQP